jgi:hypothetical protein
MVKHNPNHDPFKEVKFISPFAYETKRIPSPSLEPKPCPSGHPNIILDSGLDSTLIMHDISFEKENFCAMDIVFCTTCNYGDPNYPSILALKLFKRMVVDAFVYHKYCKSRS